MPSARQISWAKFRVTTVVLVGLLILGVLCYLLTGGTLLERKTALYLYIPDATGISTGSPMRVDGIQVGKVTSAALSGSNDPDRVVKVTITVDLASLKVIPADSTAQVSTDTMIGDKFVDVSSGKSAERQRPNSELRFQPQMELLKSLDLSQFEHQLRVVDAMMTDIEQRKNRVGDFLVGEEMYDKLRRRLVELDNGMRAATSVTSEVGRALYTDDWHRAVLTPLTRLDESLARLQGGEGTGGRLLRDDAQYRSLRAAVADLGRAVADLRQGKGPAGDLMVSDRAYLDWNRRLAGMIDTVDLLNRGSLLASSSTYDNLNGFSQELQAMLRDLRQDPRKFLRIKIF